MLRPSRRLTVALLWLAIALLPLRGFAAALMPVAMVDAPITTATDAHEAAALPCHGMASDSQAAAESGTHTCSLCDLCHASMVHAVSASVSLADLPESTPPSSATAAVEPAAPDSLFRPPRTTLA